MKRIAIFASGAGSNALQLIARFDQHSKIEVACIICNKKDAPIVERASALGVKVYVLDNKAVSEASRLLGLLRVERVDWIVLAGYLRLIPGDLISSFRDRIINLHPSLLPKFGGKGMYGRRVHEAVLAAGETETGITVHYVNEAFDDGKVIQQFKCPLTNEDDVDTIEQKIRTLEHTYFPKTVEETILATCPE